MVSPASSSAPAEDSFTHRTLSKLERRVHRLGFAMNAGLSADELREALDGPVQYLFWTPKMRGALEPLREALARDRDRYVLMTGPTFAYRPGVLRPYVERTLQTLSIEAIDILMIFWLGKTSSWSEGMREEMERLQEEGKVRTRGCSIHDRPRAGALAAEGALELFMIRYNAAHPGAEQDIFPHLERHRPVVLSYTSTAWGRLLKPLQGERALSAGECYRFALSRPEVDLVLSMPGSMAEHQQNLHALEQGPLSAEELERARAFGQRVRASFSRGGWVG